MSTAELIITLPDGTQKKVAAGTPVGVFVAEQIGRGLAKAALGAKLNGKTVDLFKPLDVDASLEVLTPKSDGGQEMLRHSAAHVVASAAQRLFPEAKVTIGPVVPEVPGWDYPGFYYDFDYEPFTPEDLEKIEAEIEPDRRKGTCRSRDASCRSTRPSRCSRRWARTSRWRSSRTSSPRASKTVSLYRHGDWVDLCRGPHVPDTGRSASSSCSRRGRLLARRHRNKQLQRIYGTASSTRRRSRRT